MLQMFTKCARHVQSVQYLNRRSVCRFHSLIRSAHLITSPAPTTHPRANMKLFVLCAVLSVAVGLPQGRSYGAPSQSYGGPQQGATARGPVFSAAAGGLQQQQQYNGAAGGRLGGAAQTRDALARTISEENVQPGDGTYRFSFETDNGISREEEGDGQAVTGTYSYTDDTTGQQVTINFVADENGYQPEGDSIPTPVPTEYPTPVVPLTDEAFPNARQGQQQSYSAPNGRQQSFNGASVRQQQSYSAPNGRQQSFNGASVRQQQSYSAPNGRQQSLNGASVRQQQSYSAPNGRQQSFSGVSARQQQVQQQYGAPQQQAQSFRQSSVAGGSAGFGGSSLTRQSAQTFSVPATPSQSYGFSK